MTPSLASRVAQLLRSLLALALVGVAVPTALIAAARARFRSASPLGGIERPSRIDWSAIERLVEDRVSEHLVADVVIRVALLVCWAAVLVFVATVVLEVFHMVRHDGLHLPDVRGIGVTQRRARVVAAGLLVLLPSIGPRSTAMALDPAGHVSSETASTLIVNDPPAAPVAPPVDPAAAHSVRKLGRYVVRPGDSIYAIAERAAGPSPVDVDSYANQLIDLNLGRQMADGQRFTNAAFLDVGWELDVPEMPVAPGISDELPPPVHVVAPGESLWSIAETELGDGIRWPEIFQTNRERTFGDGRRLDDPDVIRPGWDLAMPSQIASPSTATPPVPTQITTAEVPEVSAVPAGPMVEGDAAPAPPPAPAVDPERVHDAARRPIEPMPDNAWADGERIDVGVGLGVGDMMLAGSAVGDVPIAERDQPTFDAPRQASSQSLAPELLTLQRAVMLSVGALVLLASRRRQRMRQAAPRARIPEPTPSQRETERSLRLISGAERLARVETAIRAVARAFVDHGQRLLSIASSPEGELEVTATGPVSLAKPWERRPHGQGDRWTLPAMVPTEQLALEGRRVAPPCPAIVQLGVDDRGWDVYVDLEAIGCLRVDAPPEIADSIVTAVGAALAASVLAEVTHLVSVGVPTAAFLGHRLHRSAEAGDAAVDCAMRAVGSTAGMTASTFGLRARGTSSEAWEPAVVLVGSSAPSFRAPPGLNGVAVVSAAPFEGVSSTLSLDGDLWVLQPAGLKLQPIGLGLQEATALAELVDVPAATVPDQRRSDGGGKRGAIEGTVEWSLMVRLLGPVAVVDREGAPVAFERSKTLELVAWLATHRDRSTRSNARTALWEQDVRDATFANVVSEARRAMARCVPPPEGEEWVGRTLTDSLPLHSRVVSDADLVELALASARLQPPPEAIATLRPVVDSISGLPFEGTSYLWPDPEGLTSHLILLATTAAAELATHYLSVDDIEGVFAATGRGLRVLPGHEQLIGLRMRAHAGAGDHAGVRQEWESYERMIVADPWSDGEPSPKLVELRHELLHPSV